MKLRMYAMLDKAVQAYLPPLCFRSEGEAKRSFMDACRGQQQIQNNVGDYAFCFIGTYDDNLGQVESNAAGPVIIMEAATALAALSASAAPVEGNA